MRRQAVVFLAALLLAFVGLARAEPAPIGQATYRATLTASALIVDATLLVNRPTRADTSVRLLPASFPLVGKVSAGEASRIVLREGACWLRVSRVPKGAARPPKPEEVKFSFRVAVGRAGQSHPPEISSLLARRPDARWAALPVVSATRVLIDLPGKLYELRVVPAAAVEPKGDRLLLYPPARRLLHMVWRPTPAEEIRPVFRVEADSGINVALSSLTAGTKLTVEVLQGELGGLKLALPGGAKLRSLTSPDVGRWELAGGKVALRFRKAVRTRAKVLLRIEMLPEAERQFTWRPGVVQGAQHQGGVAYFRAAPGLLLKAVGRSGFERVSDGYALDQATGGQTLVLAYPRLPASVRLAVERLRPRVVASVASLARIERGVVTERVRVNYTVADVGVRRFQVRVGDGADVLEVKCPAMLDYEVEGGVLTVRLRKALLGEGQLELVVQRPVQRMDGVVVPRLVALGVERQGGVVGVAAGERVELLHRLAREADQMDVQRLPEWLRKLGAKLAYRYYDRPGGLVVVETAPVKPEFDALCQERCTLSEEGWGRQVSWLCSVARGEVFAFRLRLPDGVTPLSVGATAQTGRPRPVLKDWEFDAKARGVKVALTQGLKGRVRLDARFMQRVGEPVGSLPLRAIVLEGRRRHSGTVVVRSEVPVSLRPSAQRGLEARRGARGQLAFAQEEPDWQLDLDATPIKPVIEAETVAVAAVRPGQVAVEAALKLSVRKAPINSLTVRLPQRAVNSSVRGKDIQSSELKGRDWTIRFARRTLGAYLLRVTYDRVLPAFRPAQGCEWVAGTIEIPGAARHEGYLVVASASDRVEVAIEGGEGLSEVDPAEAQREWAPSLDRPVIAAYRHTAGGRLHSRITVFERAEVLKAKALGAVVETMVRADGETITTVTYDIRSVAEQFLEVMLPPGAALLGSYVNGRPVPSSTTADGATLISLLFGSRAVAGSTDEVLEVMVVYAEGRPPLGSGRTIELASPPVDIPTEALSWAVYLPEGYRVQRTDGNMRLMFRPPAHRTPAVLRSMFEDEGRVLAPAARAVGRAIATAGRWIFDQRKAILIVMGVGALLVAIVLSLRRAVPRLRQAIADARAKGGAPAVRRMVFRWAALGFVFVLFALFLAGMFLPALARVREEARRIRARNNLNQIAKAMATYLNEHGDNRWYPATTEQLKLVCPDELVFHDPGSDKPFVYLYEGEYLRDDTPPNKAMGYMEGTGGVSVVFFDSHTEFYPFGSKRLAKLLPGRRFPGPRRPGGPTAPSLARRGGKAAEVAAEFDEEIATGKLDYAQRKLLDRVKRRAQRAQAPGRVVLEPRAGPAVPAEKPAPAKAPAPGQPLEKKETGAAHAAEDLWRGQAAGYADLHRYAPVRGGRQKGALPIVFDLPSEGVWPYIFYRPVTGKATAEIKLVCRRYGASLPAKGILLVGIVGLVALVGLGAARQLRARKNSSASTAKDTGAKRAR